MSRVDRCESNTTVCYDCISFISPNTNVVKLALIAVLEEECRPNPYLLSNPPKMLPRIALRSLRSSRSFVTTSSVRMSDQFNKHRHTEDNNDDTPFEFTDENMRKVETVLGKYPDNYKQR
jgi:hypothetical protein